MTETERAAEAERQRQPMLEQARQMELRAQEQKDPDPEAANKLFGGVYYNRFYFTDHDFDLDEESPIPPMRYTDRVSKPGQEPYRPRVGINVFSVKMSTSDVGFPIHVYGTVIARDSIDHKCLYLFRLDRDDCQLINSVDESLMLTGPKRGIVLMSDVYVEMDLKIKDHGVQDRELSKGVLNIRGIARRYLHECAVESKSLATRLSTVDVMYAVLPLAVEATIVIEVVQGEDFYGEITAHTTTVRNRLLLYNTKVAGCCGANDGFIPLIRPVMSVSMKEMLVIVAKTDDGKDERTISFTPDVNSYDEDDITIGATQMHVKVTWSIVDF
ncbi:hypothetical protein QOZ80_5BG0456620 [Eleusine coracana subsp. coracana]|nr:hypothetical protein QOZ80_5BG0456620 [Eleusine coracana subsp. coracana]